MTSRKIQPFERSRMELAHFSRTSDLSNPHPLTLGRRSGKAKWNQEKQVRYGNLYHSTGSRLIMVIKWYNVEIIPLSHYKFIAKVSLVGGALAWGLDPRCSGRRLFLYRGFKFVLLFWSTVIAQRFGIANMKSNAHLNLQYKTQSKPPR